METNDDKNSITKWSKRTNKRQISNDKQEMISVYPRGVLHIPKNIIARFLDVFDEVPNKSEYSQMAVGLYYDEDKDFVGIKFSHVDNPDAYSVSKDGTVSCKSFLEYYNLTGTETRKYPFVNKDEKSRLWFDAKSKLTDEQKK